MRNQHPLKISQPLTQVGPIRKEFVPASPQKHFAHAGRSCWFWLVSPYMCAWLSGKKKKPVKETIHSKSYKTNGGESH